jgi:hypothetical protein
MEALRGGENDEPVGHYHHGAIIASMIGKSGIENQRNSSDCKPVPGHGTAIQAQPISTETAGRPAATRGIGSTRSTAEHHSRFNSGTAPNGWR